MAHTAVLPLTTSERALPAAAPVAETDVLAPAESREDPTPESPNAMNHQAVKSSEQYAVQSDSDRLEAVSQHGPPAPASDTLLTSHQQQSR